MSEGLMPCVFCGHDGARIVVADEVTDAGCEEATVPLYAAGCPYCGARGPMALSEEEAVEAWNRRAERTCRPIHTRKKWECDVCGCVIRPGFMPEFRGVGVMRYCPNCGARVTEVVRDGD